MKLSEEAQHVRTSIVKIKQRGAASAGGSAGSNKVATDIV